MEHLALVKKIPLIPNIAKLTFYGVVILGAAFGFYKGFNRWRRWIANRSKLYINSEMLEPIINSAYDVGMFAWYGGGTAIVSAIIAATCPISVPLLYLILKKRTQLKD